MCFNGGVPITKIAMKDKLKVLLLASTAFKLLRGIPCSADIKLGETRKLTFHSPTNISLVQILKILTIWRKDLIFSPVTGIQAGAEAEIYYTKKVS